LSKGAYTAGGVTVAVDSKPRYVRHNGLAEAAFALSRPSKSSTTHVGVTREMGEPVTSETPAKIAGSNTERIFKRVSADAMGKRKLRWDQEKKSNEKQKREKKKKLRRRSSHETSNNKRAARKQSILVSSPWPWMYCVQFSRLFQILVV
jgi:hypothetical protein